MALKDIIGQEKALNILRGCIIKNRIPHAFLFAGEEGIGKRFTAFNFAKTLNCQKRSVRDSESIDCCDECPSCIKIDKLTHPDFFLIVPEGNGRQITVSSIRKLQDSLSYRSFEGKWKIALIDNAETLNPSAANAFLETLEEPPSQSILILISSRPETLLPTIHSRCQRICFSPLPLRDMENLLRHKKGFSHEQSLLLGTLSSGRLGYALNENLIEQRDRSFNEFMEMLSGIKKDVWEDRDAMEKWFDWSLLWIRDIAVFKATRRTDLLINQDREDEIKDISKKATLKDILKLAREFYNIRGRLNFNLNKQLTLYHTSLLLKKMLGRLNARNQ